MVGAVAVLCLVVPCGAPSSVDGVGMPNAGADTGGCQIFVTFRPQPRLDDRYTIFARVVSGMDVVESLDVGDRVERAQ